MKSARFCAIAWILFPACILSLFFCLFTSCREKSETFRFQGSVPFGEGTESDPEARARDQWMKLRNPETGTIPRNIGLREREFIRRMSRDSGRAVGPLVEQWDHRGPTYIGGRTRALALDILDENTILAGSTSSGMWKSTDGGQSWRKTTRPEQIHSVSCIVQNRAPGKEHIWYYGTGSSYPRGGSAAGPLGTNAFYRGDGILKSTDGGESWTLLPSTVSGTETENDPFDFVWRLETFGTDGILAATSTGLFLSTDGGQTWDHVIDPGPQCPRTEIAMTSGGRFYAAVSGEGEANGIYQSDDGVTWENISPPGWPDQTLRTLIAVAPSNEDTVYFFSCEGLQTHLLKYTQGSNWTDLTSNLPWSGEMTTYGGNMMLLAVKPDDENTIFLGAVGLFRSMDGGQSFEVIGAYSDFHVDQHALVFLPYDPNVMIVGNDGGLFKSEDNTAETFLDPTSGEYRIEWESLNNGYLTTQFYTVNVDHDTPGSQTIAGGMQDNGCMFTTSADPQVPWQLLYGGDGGFTAIAEGGEYFYTSNGATFDIQRHYVQDDEIEHTNISPAQGKMGLWMAPFILDPHDNRIMYLPSQKDLWRNSDVTEIPFVFPPAPTDYNWTRLTNVQDLYISALGISEALPIRLYYASLRGEFRFLDNPHVGQPIPVEPANEGLSPGGYIHCIAVDPRDSNKLLVVYPNYEMLSIYASVDGGQHWTSVSGSLEELKSGMGAGPSVRWVSILYVGDQPVYFAGTSTGLFSTVKLDGMDTQWVQEGADTIGNMVVDMIDVRQSDGYIAVATHGNGVYSGRLTEIPPAEIYLPQIGDGVSGDVGFQTRLNLFNSGPDSSVRLEFFDSNGEPLPLDLGALGSGSSIEFTLKAGESISVQTPGSGELKVGYARVTAGVGVDGNAVFTYQEAGITQYEAGVPATTGLRDFTIYFDKSSSARNIGLALVNVGSGTAHATLRLYDREFQLVATRDLSTLDPEFESGDHLARYATEIFGEIQQNGLEEGVITVESDQPLAAVTLRQRSDPALTFPESVTTLSTFPVIPGRADRPTEELQSPSLSEYRVFYFPQVGNGKTGKAAFRTELILANTGPAATATVEFFKSDGTRMWEDLGPYGYNERFHFNLDRGEAVSVQTSGDGDLEVGYAKVSATASVGGTAVFSYMRDGVIFFETGVPAVSPRKNIAIFLDTSAENRDTGIAFANTSERSADGMIRLYDSAHTLIAEKEFGAAGMDLEGGCHLARYATELFKEIRQQKIHRGVVEITSDRPLAALTLGQSIFPVEEIQGGLYLLTAYPVIRTGIE